MGIGRGKGKGPPPFCAYVHRWPALRPGRSYNHSATDESSLELENLLRGRLGLYPRPEKLLQVISSRTPSTILAPFVSFDIHSAR